MKADLLNSIKQLGERSRRLRKISVIVFIVGLLLTATAYIAEWIRWNDAQALITLSFIGYLLIISSAAVLLVNLLHVLSLKFEV
jgi:phosphoglycerol transferase MdoB-like AlkP superfamily enzyme